MNVHHLLLWIHIFSLDDTGQHKPGVNQNSYISPCHLHTVLFMHLLLLHQIARDHFIEKWNLVNLIRTLASTSISEAKFQLDEVLPKPEPSICFPGTICDTRTYSAFLSLCKHPLQKQCGWILMDPRDLNELDGDVILLWWWGKKRGVLLINDATPPTHWGSPL